MADLVEILVEDDRWRDIDIAALAERACQQVFAELKIRPDSFEISLLACDDVQISTLNSAFRGKSTATNVLSWPAFDLFAGIEGEIPSRPVNDDVHGATGLGDIAIAYDTCRAEAIQQNLPLEAHLLHLLVHGCLHLLGYDHVLEKDAVLMEGFEVKILETLGVSDPY